MAKAKVKRKSIRIRKLLKKVNLSKSSYYSYDEDKIDLDFEDFKIIQKHFENRKKKIGIRQLKMVIERADGLIMNRKKIARIKRKYGLETEIRRKNKYRNLLKKQHEHKVAKNILNRQFEVTVPRKVFSTDITELKYRNKKAYLAVFKDLCSKEIVAANLSNRADINLTNKALLAAIKTVPKRNLPKLMIHSDQGLHFTHFSYRKILDDTGITQSMSRKGNCIDNAPVESFFGYLKDHLELKKCKELDDVKTMVAKEIKYYNEERPQLGLKKMPPSEYRRHLNF